MYLFLCFDPRKACPHSHVIHREELPWPVCRGLDLHCPAPLGELGQDVVDPVAAPRGSLAAFSLESQLEEVLWLSPL